MLTLLLHETWSDRGWWLSEGLGWTAGCEEEFESAAEAFGEHGVGGSGGGGGGGIGGW